MQKLMVEQIRSGNPRMKTMRISGFMDGELSELKSMEHKEAKTALLDMLDRRNSGTGTCWQNGYRVYGMWFDNEYAYINIVTSCD
jgi:hypothetical protein